MRDTDEAHKLTDNIYKNLIENFSPGVRHMIVCGKAYHKALSGVSSAARAFIESIGKVGYSGKLHCKGGAEEIGAAILNLAEVQKEIHAKFEECTKAVFTEVILPLEHKLDKDFKNAIAEHRKYINGHKGYVGPYVKAHEALKKFRKKSKNKYSYDEQKEAQFLKAVGRTQDKLDEFRVQGLKTALLEERKDYCFLLERLTSLAYVQSTHHRRGNELLSGTTRWKEICSNPHILPQSTDYFLRKSDGPDLVERRGGNGAGGGGNNSHNGYPGGGGYDSDTSFNTTPYRRPMSSQSAEYNTHRPVRPHSEYASPSILHSKTLPRQHTTQSSSPPKGAQVRAVYAHVGEGNNQLSFGDGDVITLIGEKSDGWQYGHNVRTGQHGWFPLSFTGPPDIGAHSNMQRAKSIGDLLDSRSVSDQSGYNTEPEMIVTSSRSRPRSLYDTSHMPVSNHNSSPANNWNNGGYDATNGSALSSFYTLPRGHVLDPSDHSYPPHFNDEYDIQSLATSSYHTNSTVPSTSGYGTPRRNSPGVPPPPPPWTAHHPGQMKPLHDLPPPPPADYSTDEEDSMHQRNPMFASVTLRKAASNDRSAPRIN